MSIWWQGCRCQTRCAWLIFPPPALEVTDGVNSRRLSAVTETLTLESGTDNTRINIQPDAGAGCSTPATVSWSLYSSKCWLLSWTKSSGLASPNFLPLLDPEYLISSFINTNVSWSIFDLNGSSRLDFSKLRNSNKALNVLWRRIVFQHLEKIK